MNKLSLVVAREEWRYWLRSKLALSVVALFFLLLVFVSVLTAQRIQTSAAELAHHQSEAEQVFVDQPDRNPHRMIHYGHYVFRTPVPLALFDPGIDAVTGQAMFLEGHRQNSATFSSAEASGDLGGLAWLTPALTYQIFAPLLIILLGHSAVVREREAKVLESILAQGVTGSSILAGKVFALLTFVVLLLVPLIISTFLAIGSGESLLAVSTLIGTYFLYLSVWVGLTVLASTIFIKRSTVLASLAAGWLVLTIVLPSVAVNVAASSAPFAGKIESELNMLIEKEELSDGHSVSVSDFEALQARLFEQYGVDRLEDLEINIRGLMSQAAERDLTEAMNLYAEKRMQSELRQANLVAAHGWISPMLAVAVASRSISGTDMQHYHEFLRQAEVLRYDFVQGINQVHAEQLSYVDDINRNRDEASYNRSRVSATNWDLLDEFRFTAEPSPVRISNASTSIMMLAVWLVFLLAFLFRAGSQLEP